MRLILPEEITDSTLTSTTITNEYPLFDIGGTYNIGDRVYYGHYVYESLIDANTGNNPAVTIAAGGLEWLQVSSTNIWKPFNKVVGDAATATGSINYTFNPANRIDGLALLNLKGISLTILVTVPIEGEVYNKTIDLIDYSDISDWYTYFFEELDYQSNVAFIDLPKYTTATISITINNDVASESRIGELIIGTVSTIGLLQRSPSVSIVDYSLKDVDEFGNYYIKKRAFSKKVDANVVIRKGDIARVNKLLAELRATPVVWIPSENDFISSTLITYGFFKDFSIVIPHELWADMNLSIEGLI